MVRRQSRSGNEFLRFDLQEFKGGKHYPIWGRRAGTEGDVMSATFQLDGQDFFALNGGPRFKFTEAISFFVNCETQEEVDELWEKLTAGGGAPQRCGWLKDKYGLSWQIIPKALGEMLGDKDPQTSQRVMQAMLQMDKIDIQRLKEAYGA
jgi:predicted 3-demethylubiquinone-9 3-methyltransferase (glyoxalase superfamily)